MVVSNPIIDDSGNLNILFSGNSQTKDGHAVGPKIVNYFLLHYISKGRGIFTHRGQTYRLQSGDSFVIEPGELVAYAADKVDPWRYDWIAFKGKEAESLIRAAGFANDVPISSTGTKRKQIALYGQIRSSLKLKSPAAKLRALGLLHLLFADISGMQPGAEETLLRDSEESDAKRIVRQAIHYLSTQYPEDISIESLAETIGYSRAHLSRLFKRHTGTAPSAYLLSLRLDNARRLLRERGELTIEQIAASAGFHDALYFSKQFKRRYGEPPTAYKAKTKIWNKERP